MMKIPPENNEWHWICTRLYLNYMYYLVTSVWLVIEWSSHILVTPDRIMRQATRALTAFFSKVAFRVLSLFWGSSVVFLQHPSDTSAIISTQFALPFVEEKNSIDRCRTLYAEARCFPGEENRCLVAVLVFPTKTEDASIAHPATRRAARIVPGDPTESSETQERCYYIQPTAGSWNSSNFSQQKIQ